MADPRVLVAGSVVLRRVLRTTTVPGYRLARQEGDGLAGAGALAAVGAALTTQETGARVVLIGRVGHDDAGSRCVTELRRRGIDVSRLVRGGATGEHLVLEDPTGARDEILVAERSDEAPGYAAELARCAPGDVLLVDSPTLVREPDLVRWAYDRDLQVVADLHPMIPAALDGGVVTAVDVAVVDAGGAGALADAAAIPASLAVHAGVLGSWWDDLHHEPRPGGTAGPHDDGHSLHVFTGALAAALAAGMDRPEAFELAVRTSAGAAPPLDAVPEVHG